MLTRGDQWIVQNFNPLLKVIIPRILSNHPPYLSTFYINLRSVEVYSLVIECLKVVLISGSRPRLFAPSSFPMLIESQWQQVEASVCLPQSSTDLTFCKAKHISFNPPFFVFSVFILLSVNTGNNWVRERFLPVFQRVSGLN